MVNILIVEDDPDINFIVSYLLAKRGFEVETAATGEEAFQKIIAFNPKIILLDVCLGFHDGRELCAQFKAIANAPVKIILYSALTSVLNPKDYHADDFIAKPFDSNRLVNMIKEHADMMSMLLISVLPYLV